MLLHSLRDPDGSHCTLQYEPANNWLRAVWGGYIDPVEALHGAAQYLHHTAALHCPYLLNDNLALRGPWFESVDWLQHAWLPHARRLGLRAIAHVVQADTREDILTLTFPEPVVGLVELQLFHGVAEAEEWLRSMQHEGQLLGPNGRLTP